ncbi:hypothetical protein A1O7_06960 [Cladophialophora yegresii CBS 114405]|uniref:Uncharacterized protein n=1 Tax=Cladophialophora yegresii CBS 114405 TaxID=1182544 RepID=W9VWL1_9EURO|nr:uncharacterized protein A1O7_06960 [Cladophialophora yegresii CBS 114405]EXJ56616.1 hypothetical protein A1O7_06960 [Cladophialophora yegresii CBS 114405]
MEHSANPESERKGLVPPKKRQREDATLETLMNHAKRRSGPTRDSIDKSGSVQLQDSNRDEEVSVAKVLKFTRVKQTGQREGNGTHHSEHFLGKTPGRELDLPTFIQGPATPDPTIHPEPQARSAVKPVEFRRAKGTTPSKAPSISPEDDRDDLIASPSRLDGDITDQVTSSTTPADLSTIEETEKTARVVSWRNGSSTAPEKCSNEHCQAAGADVVGEIDSRPSCMACLVHWAHFGKARTKGRCRRKAQNNNQGDTWKIVCANPGCGITILLDGDRYKKNQEAMEHGGLVYCMPCGRYRLKLGRKYEGPDRPKEKCDKTKVFLAANSAGYYLCCNPNCEWDSRLGHVVQQKGSKGHMVHCQAPPRWIQGRLACLPCFRYSLTHEEWRPALSCEASIRKILDHIPSAEQGGSRSIREITNARHGLSLQQAEEEL